MEWSQSKLNENKNKEIQSITFEAMLSFNLSRLSLSLAKFPEIGYCRVGGGENKCIKSHQKACLRKNKDKNRFSVLKTNGETHAQQFLFSFHSNVRSFISKEADWIGISL